MNAEPGEIDECAVSVPVGTGPCSGVDPIGG